jgi:hypothetical protein
MSLLRYVPLAFTALTVPVFAASAQDVSAPSAESRARVIAASFNKSKHVSKERRGIRKEKFLEITSAPALETNPSAYSGSYRADWGFSLDLRVAPDGAVQGSGHDPVEFESSVMRPFTLTNARVQGALLTATKTYANGAAEKLEGVFIDRTTRTSSTDPGSTAFGLGVTGDFGHVSGVTLAKIFYQRTR